VSKLSEALRAKKVYNNWDAIRQFGSKNSVCVDFYPPAHRADYHKSIVWGPHQKERWTFGGIKRVSFAKAMAFAEKKFGDKYVTSPFGGKLPEQIVKKLKEYAK
jgi:hypothetical protein